MQLIIQSEQRDALLAYLQERPYREVAVAMTWLRQLPEALSTLTDKNVAVGYAAFKESMEPPKE